MCTGNCQFILQCLKGCFNTLWSLQDHYRVELLRREIPVVITRNRFAVKPSLFTTGVLTPRQVLLCHLSQQMVWLYWLQDRDSMPNWYNINHPTTLHTHNETKWPTAPCRWHFEWRDVSRMQSCNLLTLSQCDNNVDKLSADAGSLCCKV